MIMDDRTRISNLYQSLAPVYSKIRPLWARTFNRKAERYLEQVVLPEALYPAARVLDLGCGPGTNLARLRRLKLPFARFVGIDISPSMLVRAEFKDIMHRTYLVGDAYRLPFKAGSFDLVLSTWMFSHLLDPISVVEEVLRLLPSGGWLIVACFSRSGGYTNWLHATIESAFYMRSCQFADYETWPGLVDVKTFAGGWNSVVRLRKDA